MIQSKHSRLSRAEAVLWYIAVLITIAFVATLIQPGGPF